MTLVTCITHLGFACLLGDFYLHRDILRWPQVSLWLKDNTFKALPVSPSANKITLANVIGNSGQKAPQMLSKRLYYQLELTHFLQVGV